MLTEASQQDDASIQLQEKLAHREADLFVEDERNVDVRCFKHDVSVAEKCGSSSAAGSKPSATTVNNVAGLEDFFRIVGTISSPELIQAGTGTIATQFLIISQKTSWSRLRITSEMFYLLCKSCIVSPDLATALVSHFGKKFDEDLRTNSICKVKQNSTILEICYTIQHFEPHRRQLEDPWSCREMGICQTSSLIDCRSSYVLIQGPSRFDRVVEKYVADQGRCASREFEHHPLSFQLKLVVAVLESWSTYLEYLETTVKDPHTIISFPHNTDNREVQFELIYQLNQSRCKTMRARSILQSTINVVQTLATQSSKISSRNGVLTDIEVGFIHLISDLQDHVGTTNRVLESIKTAEALLLEICKHRLTAKQSDSLTDLNDTASDQARLVTVSQGGTFMFRISTFLALIYLPFTLAATIFSSNLVSVAHGDTGLTERGAVGWFLAVTVVLHGITAAVAWVCSWWDRRRQGPRASQP